MATAAVFRAIAAIDLEGSRCASVLNGLLNMFFKNRRSPIGLAKCRAALL